MTTTIDWSDITLTEMVDAMFNQARHVLLDLKRDEIVPCFLMIDDEGIVTCIPTPYRNSLEKKLLLEAVRSLMKDMHCIKYSFISEAWSVERPTGSKIVPAAEQPDRIEVLQIFATDGKMQRHKTWRMVRNSEENLTDLTPLGDKEVSTTDRYAVVGRFTNLLSEIH